MRKLQIKKCALSCACALAVGASFAEPTLTTYYWASNETSLVSGSFGDAANWLDSSFQPAGKVPGERSLASFYHLPNDEYTVDLPQGDYSNFASLQIYSRQGKAVTIDGRGSVFVSPSTAMDNYSKARVRLYTSAEASADDKKSEFSIDCGDAGDFTSGYCLSNVVWRFKSRWNSNASIESIEFRQGLFNFYDFDGTPHNLRLYTYSSNPASGSQPITLTFCSGSSLRIYDFYPVWQYGKGHTLVNFDGGEHHIFGTFNLFKNKWSDCTESLPSYTDVHIGGDATVCANVLKVWHGTATQNYGPCQRTLVAVENGGTLTATGGVNWATFNEQRLYVTNGAYCAFGPFDGSAARPVNNFANTAIQANIGTNIVAVVVDNARFDMTGTNRIGNVEISLHDSTFNLAGYASIGHSAGRAARLCATNSTVALNLDSGNALYIGNAGTGVVELVQSDMTLLDKTSLYIGNDQKSHGEFVLDGGSYARGRAVKNGNEVWVGHKGSGSLVVKDGLFEAYDIFAHYENSGTTCPTCIVHQTGGTIKITAGSFTTNENPWYAARFGQHTSAGVTKLVLDGGEFQAARMFATHSAIDSPSTGCHTYFEADGGTIVGLTPSDGTDNVITLRNFEKASLGSKGLTIRTFGETRTEQDFCDKEGSEGSGRLTLAGEGVKKLSGTNSTESVLVCAGGKTLFVPNATTGADASHYSNVIVTNGATLSIAGAQMAATFRSLTLARGAHIEMEKSDRYVIDGAALIEENLSLEITDGAVVGTYPLIVCNGEVSAESVLNWRRAVVTISGSANLGVTPVASYDAPTGKTTLSLEITEGGPLTGNMNWNGTWNATGADCVTFAGGGTSSVAVDSDVMVGALAFDSSVDYSLSGDGTLVFSNRGGYARVDVAHGEQTISSKIEAPPDLTLAVASGAKLTIDGEIVVGGIVKDGRGTVSVENAANEPSAGVTVREGLLTASTPGALGKGPIALKGGTLEINGEGVVDASSVMLATEYAATAAVVKVDADVSMPAPSATQGAFIKRGPGRLTLVGDRSVPICGPNSGTLATENDKRVMSTTTFDAEGNYAVDGQYAFGGFNVADGELVLRGAAPDVTFSVPAYVCVGIGTSQGAASPGLVVDHATLACSGSRFLFGTTYNSSFADSPYLIVTNKATLTGTFSCGQDAYTANLAARVLFDDSVHYSPYRFYPMRGNKHAEYVYRNGSALYVNKGGTDAPTKAYDGVVFNDGTATLTFSNSVLARKTAIASDVFLPVTIAGESSGKAHDVRMRDGSTLYSNWVTNKYSASAAMLTVGFDNSEWKPIRSDETGDFTFDFPPYESVRFEMEGRGVILSPSEGRTFSVVSPFVGEGGLRKQGSGTLAFASKDGMKSWDFAGTMSLEGGIVTLDEGAARAGAKVDIAPDATLVLNGTTLEGPVVSGGGTVSNGTLDSSRIMVDVTDAGEVSSSVKFSNVAFAGRTVIDFGRTVETPVPNHTMTVALFSYAGNAPDVSGWQARGLGRENVIGSFDAANGVVTCTISRTGFVLIVR